MIRFTIKNVEQEYQKIYVLPYEVTVEGCFSSTEKQQYTTVNGHELSIGDRVVVKGKISPQLPIVLHREWAENFQEGVENTWACCFHWDGYSLTSFPKREYIENCKDVIHLEDE